MGQMDSVHFCRFKSNSPAKLIGTVIIHFVHESFISVTSDSSPGSNDALPGCQLKTRRGCVPLQPGRLCCSAAAAWPISALGQDQLFALQPASFG